MIYRDAPAEYIGSDTASAQGQGKAGAPRRVFERLPKAPPLRLITPAEFAELYTACAFALRFGMPLDTSLTVSWKLLDRERDGDVQLGFTALTKCIRDWLSERGFPCAFIYGHERGPQIGLHTHIALYIPGRLSAQEGRTSLFGAQSRSEFRHYMREWTERHAGHRVTRAVRLRGSSVETPWMTWRLMNYLVKGYDRTAIVQSGAHSPDGVDVHLGDLIATPWKDPGVVTLAKRVGVSRSLGRDRRLVGVPGGPEHLFSYGPPWALAADFDVSGLGSAKLTRQGKKIERPSPAEGCVPFRSAYEDGIRDVRKLYPPEFVRFVTGVSAEPTPPAIPVGVNDGDLDGLACSLSPL